MCGIFGMILGASSSIKSSVVLQSLEQLLKLSQARGTESSGFALIEGDSIFILKEAIKATDLVKTKQYRALIEQTQLNDKWVEF